MRTRFSCSGVGSKSRDTVHSLIQHGRSLSSFMHSSLSDRLQVALIVQPPTSAIQVMISSGVITDGDSASFFFFCLRSLAGFVPRGTRPPWSSQLHFMERKIPRRELICGVMDNG